MEVARAPNATYVGHVLGHRGPRPWKLPVLYPGALCTAVVFSISPGLKLHGARRPPQSGLSGNSRYPGWQSLPSTGTPRPLCRNPGWGRRRGPRLSVAHGPGMGGCTPATQAQPPQRLRKSPGTSWGSLHSPINGRQAPLAGPSALSGGGHRRACPLPPQGSGVYLLCHPEEGTAAFSEHVPCSRSAHGCTCHLPRPRKERCHFHLPGRVPSAQDSNAGLSDPDSGSLPALLKPLLLCLSDIWR